MAATAPKKRSAKRRIAKPRDPLTQYRTKRDSARTREPSGKHKAASSGGFVVQKHGATRRHFDLRLEIDGVLKSWAMPKGIPTEPGERRLAVMVEDHPRDYGGFESTIPKGEYGTGIVMLWDRGTFRAGDDDPSRALREGKLHLFLDGGKLCGEWALVRIRGEEKHWLLIKVGEALKVPRRTWDRSIASGRAMEEITGVAAMRA